MHTCLCGSKAIKRTGSGWACQRCIDTEHMHRVAEQNKLREKKYSKPVKEHPTWKFYRAEDCVPIAGIGESLLYLEKLLKIWCQCDTSSYYVRPVLTR